ncbi:hypothetical protein N9P01_03355 [Gammaproteobacteria bacterium]|nr:hypothetical protein [Gammaproteobacteria bacterium]
MKTLTFKTFSIAAVIFIASCSPKTSNLNGDVFLTMKNGAIKPVAGNEIYLFPIQTDFDSSFVFPLKEFINSAKYNIAKNEVADACNAMDEDFPNMLSDSLVEIKNYYQNGVFVEELESACKVIAENIDVLNAEIKIASDSADQESKPIRDQITSKEEEAQAIRKKIYKLALDQGTILKNEQASKVLLTAQYQPPGYISPYSAPDDLMIEYTVRNNSDYIIKSVELGPYTWKGKPALYSGDSEILVDEYFFNYSWHADGITIDGGSKTNQYGELLPGLVKGSISTSDSIKAYTAWPNERWLDENLKDIKTKDHTITEDGYCKTSSYTKCASYEVFSVDLGFRDIVDITFGMPHKITTDANNKSRIYTTEDVNWVEMGRNTSTYQSSTLHDELKGVQNEIVALNARIKEIKDNFSIKKDTKRVASLNSELSVCNNAINLRDTEREIQQCLQSIDDRDSLVTLVNNSNSTFGADISEIFNAVSDEDLGYTNFEELLNAFAKSRNAIVAVSSIQGAYSFNEVPLGKYVVFTSYEDRFNGVGHWFEEIDFIAETKLDLNNLNYKESGVYSYLRDKIDD